MNNEFYEDILKNFKLGLARLSPKLKVVFANTNFQDLFLNGAHSSEKAIYDLIPETVGLEDTLQKIISGRVKHFELKFLTRRDDSNSPLYFNLFFIGFKNPAEPILCIVEDVTENALQKQYIAQQKNDIRLLESYLISSNEFLSASILGASDPILNIRKKIEKIATVATATVLLLGESGTGKSLVAKIIHYSSKDPKSPFVEINCAAIPESLLESELFGYEKGAFTGALESRKGLLEEAHGGTLFLDEIGELPLKLQAKLLTFLETRKFRPLGSNKEKDISVRLITATNRDLNKMIENAEFREDLLYRLKVVTLNLPPLRDLGTDIILIANHFINIFNIEFKKHVKSLSTHAEQKLLSYYWPGNVRELSNVIERAMIFIETDTVEVDDLILQTDLKENRQSKWQIPPEGISMDEVERQLIFSALENSNGNKSKAAKLLRLSRDTFCYRLNKFKPQ